ncbi:helix-turn-helix transcriptional regulator [bacterium]|nr:helix-turn-helix transcriptional regulator [bacterium]
MNKNDDKIKLGAKIAYLRKIKGFSQQKLAEKTGMSEIYLGAIERGNANPTLWKLKLISEALEVGIDELFDFSL